MQARGYLPQLVQLPPLCAGEIKPGQYIKIVKVIKSAGVYCLGLFPLTDREVAEPANIDDGSLIAMEVEGWITSPLGRYLGIRLPFYLIAENDSFDLCPLRLVGGNVVATLMDNEFAHLTRNGKLEADCDGIEELLTF